MATNTNITNQLLKQFEKHRIVFWYDNKQELRGDYESLELDGVEKIEIANNELGIKHRILREHSDTKFLLYHEGPKPEPINNWLLDVQLAHDQFRTGQAALWLADLDLGSEFAEIVEDHVAFFSKTRLTALKKKLEPRDEVRHIRMKMLAVCAGTDARIDAILEGLLGELAANKGEKIKLIVRCGLDGFFWSRMEKVYGYTSTEPGMKDFALELFKSCYEKGTDGNVTLSSDALVFLKRWKDSRRYAKSFKILSNQYASPLGIEEDLVHRDYRDLIELDYFELIDRKVIHDLVQAVVARTISTGDCTLMVRQRKQSFWYPAFEHVYCGIETASLFFHTLDAAQLALDSLAEGVQRYSSAWFKLDQLYRKFIYHLRQSGQASLLGELAEQVENHYSTNYLLKLNDRWQQHIDQLSAWEISGVSSQRDFFKGRVKPLMSKGKVFVLVSDALRFEVAEELQSTILQANKYNAELDCQLGMLPSSTKLGMAALLPHKEIAFTPSAGVRVDGMDSSGLEARKKILAGAVADSTAVRAKDLLTYGREELRALCRDHSLVYVYHDLIDFTGHKVPSEERVFDAVETTIEELSRVITKVGGENYIAHFLITADHGFIYQHRAIDESDFSSADVSGEEIDRDRRFVIGRGLGEDPGLKKFSSEALGLNEGFDVAIPKSINRLRQRGACIRYVHGGASLQEIVIPVLTVQKRKKSDVSKVEIDILRGSSSVISTGQLAVALYQASPVSEKVQPRTLQAGIYTQEDVLISDERELIFNLTSDNPRERELQVRFVMTRDAEQANGQEVELRLKEKISGSTRYEAYKSMPYTLRRSFTSDFDF